MIASPMSRLPDDTVVFQLSHLLRKGLTRDEVLGLHVAHPLSQSDAGPVWEDEEIPGFDTGRLVEVFDDVHGPRGRFVDPTTDGYGLHYDLDNLWVDPKQVLARRLANGTRARVKRSWSLQVWDAVLQAALPVPVHRPEMTLGTSLEEMTGDHEIATVISAYEVPWPAGDVAPCQVARIVLDGVASDAGESTDGMPSVYAWDVPTWMLDVVEEREQVEQEPIHAYFGLSYSNFLVLPRAVLQSMPPRWQAAFVGLLRTVEGTARRAGVPMHDTYRVQPVGPDGKLLPSSTIPHYDRGRLRLF